MPAILVISSFPCLTITKAPMCLRLSSNFSWINPQITNGPLLSTVIRFTYGVQGSVPAEPCDIRDNEMLEVAASASFLLRTLPAHWQRCIGSPHGSSTEAPRQNQTRFLQMLQYFTRIRGRIRPGLAKKVEAPARSLSPPARVPGQGIDRYSLVVLLCTRRLS